MHEKGNPGFQIVSQINRCQEWICFGQLYILIKYKRYLLMYL